MQGNGTVMNEWKFREQMCEIGRRIYNKGFAAANDGNISLRLERRPGALLADAGVEGLHEARRPVHRRPGRQAGLGQAQAVERDPAASDDHEGPRRRAVGRALSSASCHRVRRRPRADPQVRPARDRGLPGRSRHLSYETPGGQSFADTVLPFVKDTDTILLANHGTVTYGSDLEDAYFKTEIIDAYCRILILARQIGRVNYYTDEKAAELLRLKPKLGIPDPRLERGLENCDLCGNSLFREGYGGRSPEPQVFIHPKIAGSEPVASPIEWCIDAAGQRPQAIGAAAPAPRA